MGPGRGAALAALAIDAVCGEPPTVVHPTALVGRLIAAGRARRTARGPTGAFMEGLGVLVGAVMLGGLGGASIDATIRAVQRRARHRATSSLLTVGRGAALKPALAVRALVAAGRVVEDALRAGRLDEARRLAGVHLVSRDTAALSASEVAGATISSLAENLNDSVVAPLLAFRVAGLAGAYAYRAANTADSMLGYRTSELEWFGKPAARADDILSWIPARLSAALIALAAPAGQGSARDALALIHRDARRTTSPNAGWPMAAMAGALGVTLVKRDVYRLHDEGRPPSANDIARARRVVSTAAWLAAAAVDLW